MKAGTTRSLWLLVGLLVGILGVFTALGSGVGEQRRLEVEQTMHAMSAIDTQLKLDVLRLRNRQQQDYDSLVDGARQMVQLQAYLAPRYEPFAGSASLQPLRQSWNLKMDLAEAFKQHNAVLTNSLDHFINLAGYLEARQHQSVRGLNSQHLDATSAAILVFLARGEQGDIPATARQLDLLLAESHRWAAADRQMAELLVAHGRKILGTHLEVRRLIDLLGSDQFQQATHLAYRAFEQAFESAARQAERYRLGMAAFSLLLILTLGRLLASLRQTSDALEQSHRLLDNITRHLGEGILGFDAHGQVNFLNHRAEVLFDQPGDALRGASAATLFGPEDHESRRLLQSMASHLPFTGDCLLLRGTLEPLPVAVLGGPLPPAPGASAEGYVLSFRDLSDMRRALSRLHLAGRVFDNLAEAMTVTSPDGRIESVNQAFTTITGFSEAEAIGRKPGELLASGMHDAGFYAAMWQDLSRDGRWSGEIINRRKSGETYPEWLSITAVRDGEGEISHYVGLFADITERKEAEAYIHHLAYHDALTGLANRVLFNDRLNNALQQARRAMRPLAVMMLDLDRFKAVNDSLGHSAGDVLLKEVARRLESCLREGDTLARLGGDEFALLMPEIHSPVDAAACARKLLARFEDAVELDAHEVFASTSIGIAIFPNDGDTPSALLKHADQALYAAKDAGRNAFRFHVAGEEGSSLARLQLESALRHALRDQALRLYYQLQFHVDSGAVAGVEALVRWQHPELGLLAPSLFIPIAESTGLIDGIGAWVLEQGCRQMAEWVAKGVDIPRLAVNVSARQLRRPNFVAEVLAVVEASGIDPQRLELELTESMLSDDVEQTFTIFAELRQHGIRVALDDFGTGYSSLSYLAQYPVDVVKIDQSFVRNLEHDKEAQSVVQAIILLAHGLSMTTIAEGVEVSSQEVPLRDLGCDELQGYLFAHPCPADELPALIEAARMAHSTPAQTA